MHSWFSAQTSYSVLPDRRLLKPRSGVFLRAFLGGLLGALVIASVFAPAYASVRTKAKIALIMDYESGQILFERDGQRPMAPASMSKLMTIAILFDMIQNGELTLDTKFSVSEAAWRRGQGTGESKMWVLVGDEIALRDLLRGIIIQSGNDAAQVVAENIAGSEEAFAKLMNSKAAAWGLTQSTFANATGMPDPNQKMSARDLALLTRKIIHDYPGLYPIFAEAEFTWSNITQANRNPLLKSFDGADGMKTGHTEKSGYGLVGTAFKDGQRRIIVLNGLESAQSRSREATRLMEQAFDLFDHRIFFTAGTRVGEADVFMGRVDKIGLVVHSEISFLTARTALDQASGEIVYQAPLRAPIDEGEQVAVLRISMPGQEAVEFPLYAEETVREVGFFAKIGFGLRSLLTPPDSDEVEG